MRIAIKGSDLNFNKVLGMLISLVPSPYFFLCREMHTLCMGEENVGPGTHCLHICTSKFLGIAGPRDTLKTFSGVASARQWVCS